MRSYFVASVTSRLPSPNNPYWYVSGNDDSILFCKYSNNIMIIIFQRLDWCYNCCWYCYQGSDIVLPLAPISVIHLISQVQFIVILLVMIYFHPVQWWWWWLLWLHIVCLYESIFHFILNQVKSSYVSTSSATDDVFPILFPTNDLNKVFRLIYQEEESFFYRVLFLGLDETFRRFD